MIKLSHWNGSAADCLSAVDSLDLELTQMEIECGISQLWKFNEDGYAVTKLRREGNEVQLILVACAGKHFADYLPLFVNAAHEKGITCYVMVHNPAMRRMYMKAGFVDHHFVLRSR